MNDTLLAQLATDIHAEHAAATTADGAALGHARRCGDLLISAKRQITHGGWVPFVEQCEMSVRVAQMYMQVARNWSSLEEQTRNGVSLFSLRDALAALRQPGERREPPVPPVQWKEMSDLERCELRRITEEMTSFPFVKRTFNERTIGPGFEIVPGAAGAPVYWDIVGGSADGGAPAFHYTRQEVCEKLDAFMDGGPRSVVTDLAVHAARGRLAGEPWLSRPLLPPVDECATVVLTPETVEHCRVLAEIFKTSTLAATVAEAIAFTRFSYSTELLDNDEIVTAAEIEEAIAQ